MSSQASPATHPLTSTQVSAAVVAVQAVSPPGVRRGPRGNLARFDREQANELKTPIQPLDFCRLNDPEWFPRMQQVVLDLRNGINRPNSTVAPAMLAHVNANLLKLEKLPIGKQFDLDPRTGRRYPDLQISGIRRERAIELGRALLVVTSRDPHLVRHAALGYMYAVDNRMQVRLTDREYAPYGRVLIGLVDQVAERLDPPWLRWCLVGFEVDGEHKDPAGWFADLGVKATEIRFSSPHTPHNRAELDHIRIDVCVAGGENRLSREFYEVMLLVAVTELWKCVRS